MDIKSLVAQASKYLSPEEAIVFRKQVNEIYLQSELHALIAGMPLDKEPEPWRANKMFKINQQLASIHV